MSDNPTRRYWRSVDPTVVRRIGLADRVRAGFDHRVDAFNEHYGVRASIVVNPFTSGLECAGVRGDTTSLPGRWTRPNRRGVSRPYQANPDGRRLIDALTCPYTDIPGLPARTSMQTLDGIIIRHTVVFLAHGVAYAGVGPGEPDHGCTPVDTTIWQPITVKEWEWASVEAER